MASLLSTLFSHRPARPEVAQAQIDAFLHDTALRALGAHCADFASTHVRFDSYEHAADESRSSGG